MDEIVLSCDVGYGRCTTPLTHHADGRVLRFAHVCLYVDTDTDASRSGYGVDDFL